MNNYYNCVYMYTNKTNGKRYIGQTKDFRKRHTAHNYATNSNKNERDYNTPIHNAMRKYGIDNFNITILAHDVPTQDKLNEYEIFFIKRYNTLVKNGKGYNVSIGGNINYYKPKEVTDKQKEQLVRLKETNKGKKRSEEVKAKFSKIQKERASRNDYINPRKGKHHTEEAKKKIGEAHKGNKYGAKKVLQYDLDGNLIKIWDCTRDVAEFGFTYSLVTKCCRKERKTHKGFIWKYEGVN